MIWFLRIAFSLVVIVMLCVTSWAGSQVAIWNIPREVATHPWFIATLFDCYFGFLTFYVWLAYRERSIIAKIVWLIAILALGNIAMAAYVLSIVFRLPANASFTSVLLRPTKT